MSLVIAPARPIAQRVAWGALTAFLLAFLVFEVVKHGGATWATALLLLIAPDLTIPNQEPISLKKNYFER